MSFVQFYSRKHKQPFDRTNDTLKCEDEVVEIVNDIPRFVGRDNYALSFGDQWNKFRKTQLDSHTGLPITETRLRRCMGELYDQLAGKNILEAGCGAGRFTELLLKQGARVASADLSHAVDANIANCPLGENHIVLQADINQLPFAEEQFDVVICLGVIQHTADPEKTITNLFSHVKKGGSLIIDHYAPSFSRYTKSAFIFRYFLKRMAPEKRMGAVEKIVNFFFPLHYSLGRNRLMYGLLTRVSPVLSYFHSLPDLSREAQYEWALLDTHDSLTDFFKHLRTTEQIKAFLSQLNSQKVECWVGGNGVEARCKKA